MNNRYAILVIDMLNDFINGKLRLDGVEDIIQNIQKLLDSARQRNIPIIYCNDAHDIKDRELKIWGEHAIKRYEGCTSHQRIKTHAK